MAPQNSFCLQPGMTINKFTAQALRSKSPRMATAFNRAPSPLPFHRPQQRHQGQFGSFNPASPYGWHSPVYTPFVGDPYLASVFTGMPPQPAPVYNITHVYNSPMPQPQQQQKPSTLHDYNGMFTLLNGALKSAGTVLGARHSRIRPGNRIRRFLILLLV
jgi:hypothetical protein